jgi:hypothetical protein
MGKTYTNRTDKYEPRKRDREYDAPNRELRNTERQRPERQPMGFSGSRDLKRNY